MDPIVKFSRRIVKLNLLHNEIKDMMTQIIAGYDNLAENSYFQSCIAELGNFEQYRSDFVIEKSYNDFLLQYILNLRGEIIASKVYGLHFALVFSLNGYIIKSFADEVREFKYHRNLFFKNLALISKNDGDESLCGLISDTGEFVVQPVYKEISYLYFLYNKVYFLVTDKYNSKGIIDHCGRIVLPVIYDDIKVNTISFSYNHDFIAVKKKKYYLINFKCDYEQIDKVYFTKGENCKILKVFSSIIESFNSTYIAHKGKRQYWLDSGLSEILAGKGVFNKINVFSDEVDPYDEVLFACVKSETGKWGMYKYNEKRWFPCVYDRVVVLKNKYPVFRQYENVVLVKGKNKYLYNFERNISINIPDEIIPLSIKEFREDNSTYYAASHCANKMWAVFDKNFNPLTGYIFHHAPDFRNSNKGVQVFVPEFMMRDTEIDWDNEFYFSVKEFFRVFGKRKHRSKSEFLKNIDKDFVTAEQKKGILFSDMYVAGTYYFDSWEASFHINVNDELYLKGDLTDIRDRSAISLYYKHKENEYKLGYLPRFLNRDIREFARTGVKFRILVTTVHIRNNIADIIFNIVGE